jgi:hypothetical protein
MTIPEAAWPKAWDCRLLIPEIAGSNPVVDMVFRILYLLCVGYPNIVVGIVTCYWPARGSNTGGRQYFSYRSRPVRWLLGYSGGKGAGAWR